MQGSPSADDRQTGTEKPLAPGGPDPDHEERVMLLRNRVSRIFYLRKFFDYPVSLKVQTFKNMGPIRTFKAGVGYVKSSVIKKKEDNLENFYINRFGRPLYEMFFKDYTEKVWGRSPDRISAAWGAQRVKGLSLMSAVWNVVSKPFRSKDKVETSLIEQFSYPKKGPGQLWETLADEVRALGGEIVMNSCVNCIHVDGNRVTGADVRGTNGDAFYTADYFISSMPVRDLVASIGEAAPQNVRRIAADLPYRDFMTVGILANKLTIENQTKIKTPGNIVPDCWIYIQERDVQIGRLQIFNNWSPYMVADPQNSVWIGLEYFCCEGDNYWNMSDGDFIDFAVGELESIGVISRGDVLDAVRLRVPKAYPAYFDAYDEFDTVREFLDTKENLFCVGRNGQHRYNNMDHSMLTAIEAVRAIKEGKTSKADIWGVNTEEDYHEQKSGGR